MVALLAGYHLYLWRLMRQIAEHPGRRGARFYRWINEVPSAFLVVIVLLAVTKPF